MKPVSNSMLLFQLLSITSWAVVVLCCQMTPAKSPGGYAGQPPSAPTTPAPTTASTTSTPISSTSSAPSGSTKPPAPSCGAGRLFLNTTEGAKIIGGSMAQPHDFPWLVRLLISKGSDIYVMCGASIISDRWLLTAAHCVRNAAPSAVMAIFGDWDLEVSDPGEYSMAISQTIVHGSYNQPKRNYDFALLQTSRPIDFNSNLQPVCLPTNCPDSLCSSPGNIVVVAGWGTTVDGGNTPSRYLQRGNVAIVANSQCQGQYAGQSITITQQELCAGTPDGSVDACQGDSGGPLMAQDPTRNRYQLCGVTSFGQGCGNANYPGVYGDVCSIVDWIKANTNNLF